MKISHNHFIKLAFNIAKINLGKTNLNPSVGCVIVKNNSVISSGVTSVNGRPHAEFNALKLKKKFSNSDLYVTMEPCTHYGLTPPCTKAIVKKKIKRVFYSFNDFDKRTKGKAQSFFINKKIKIYKKKEIQFKDFYDSHYLIHKKSIPLIDAKIALSSDYFTIRKKSQWITNDLSRKRAHLIRSEYDAIISTSASINKDNSLLNCRINGLNNYKPDLIIIDLNLKIKKNLKIFKNKSERKILIITSVINHKKFSFFKKKGVNIIFQKSLSSQIDFINLFKRLKTFLYSRILVESGLTFLNSLLKERMINNLYVFKSKRKLKNLGKNNSSINILKKIKLTNRIKVNLDNDKLYKVEFNNV